MALLGGLLEGDRGLMQELIQQRLAELLDTRAVLGGQMAQLFERVLDLGNAQSIHARAKLLDCRNHAQPTVPCPEQVGFLLDDPFRSRNLIAAPCGGLCGDGLEIVDVI
jgi:hypothetical protein